MFDFLFSQFYQIIFHEIMIISNGKQKKKGDVSEINYLIFTPCLTLNFL